MAAECRERTVESVEELGMIVEPIMRCCLCKSLLQNPVQLVCLHNCCQQCFIDAASVTLSGDVGCVVCGEITSAGIERPNRFIDHEVRFHKALAGWKMCFICKEDRHIDQEAVEWCPVCRHALCENCVPAHKRYNKSHSTLSLDSLGDSGAIIQQPSVTSCSRHDKPLELACFACEKEICTSCWEHCSESKHEVHVLSNPYFNNHVERLKNTISWMVEKLLRKVPILSTPKSHLTDLKAARRAHLLQIEQRKQFIIQTVDKVVKKLSDAVEDKYDDLEKQATDAAVAADCLKCKVTDAQSYINKLFDSKSNCDIFTQKNIVEKRLNVLSTELAQLDSLCDRLEKMIQSEPFISSTQPHDLEVLIEKWIGTFEPSAFSFSEASVSHKLPVTCCDVALTNDGHLLLAAGSRGLIELCSETGNELSHWLPPQPRRRDGYECVNGVASLGDERAAVSLDRELCVVLLKRSGGDCRKATEIENTSWTEYHRFDTPEYVPEQLSAHGDILAVADATEGCRCLLQLMCLRSLRPLTHWFNAPFGLESIVLTPRVVVTYTKRRTALEAYLVPACEKRLWCQVLNTNDGKLQAICADTSGGVVYAAMKNGDHSGGHLMAFSLVDGSLMRRVALSFGAAAEQPLLLPKRLSLRTVGAVAKEKQGSRSCSNHSRVLQLVALCCDSATGEWNTLTVHQSKCDA